MNFEFNDPYLNPGRLDSGGDNRLNPFGCLIAFLIAMLLCAILGGCASKQQAVNTVYQTRTDTVYRSKTDTVRLVRLSRDTLIQHDSVFVREFTKGDTVYRWRDRFTDKIYFSYCTDTIYKSKTDTLWKFKTDTLTRTETVTVEVEKPKTTWQRITHFLGGLVVWAVIAGLVIGIVSRFRDQ